MGSFRNSISWTQVVGPFAILLEIKSNAWDGYMCKKLGKLTLKLSLETP